MKAADPHAGTDARAEEALLRIIDGAPGVLPACARGGLALLSALYGAGLEVNLACYALRLARVTRLPAQVIGIGNLSMGGTGKTLAVQRLARECAAAGNRVAILSRGYRRTSRTAMAVVSTPDAVLLSAADAGDEPCLLAASLPGIPVLVGKNRRETGRYAVEHFGADTLILDDSFQYWRLRKDREIVLIDALQSAGRDRLFPRGLFREPWAHLRRAHEVWLTHAQLADPARVVQLAGRIRRAAPGAHIRYTEHRPTRLRSSQGEEAPLAMLAGRRVLAVSGLGNPHQFETMLAALGAEVTPCRFRDHHPFDEADLALVGQQAGAQRLVVTTSKDAMRLPEPPPFPYWVVEVEIADVPAPAAAPTTGVRK